MEVKTKHKKYANFFPRQQLAQKGLIPGDKGIDLWSNQFCKTKATYFDLNKAQKITTIYIYKNYLIDNESNYMSTELSAVDQLGNTLFNELIRPDNKWLKKANANPFKKYSNADIWVQGALRSNFSYKDILFAQSYEKVSEHLIKVINQFKYIDTIISYNVGFNVPVSLIEDEKYKKIDLMTLFAEVIKEPLEPQKEYYNGEYEIIDDDQPKYKWQKLSKCFEYYKVKPDSQTAYAYANAIRMCYQQYR